MIIAINGPALVHLRHRLFCWLHPRAYRAGLLAEQRHQFLDLAEPPLACDGPALPTGGTS